MHFLACLFREHYRYVVMSVHALWYYSCAYLGCTSQLYMPENVWETPSWLPLSTRDNCKCKVAMDISYLRTCKLFVNVKYTPDDKINKLEARYEKSFWRQFLVLDHHWRLNVWLTSINPDWMKYMVKSTIQWRVKIAP